MKNSILALLLVMLSGSAMADYSQTVARQRYCTATGRIGAAAYQDRLKGTPKEAIWEKVASGLQKGGKDAETLRFAVNYGYDQAVDGEDAHMKSWANCMDVLN
jgi:opacity protein-like surface antigen